MSVRVVARVRPLLKSERELDVILRTGASGPADPKSRQSIHDDRKLAALRDRDNVVRIPNPKNVGEEYTFQFNAVYDADVSQQELFDAEGGFFDMRAGGLLLIGLAQLRLRSSTCLTDST